VARYLNANVAGIQVGSHEYFEGVIASSRSTGSPKWWIANLHSMRLFKRLRTCPSNVILVSWKYNVAELGLRQRYENAIRTSVNAAITSNMRAADAPATFA
jgi:hypothetical protein